MKNLLKKWINGSVTWSAEKQLRQAAENDHFLAEAMEGYDAFPVADHGAKIEVLKQRFRKPEKKEKRGVFMLSKVAAAAVIIGVTGTLFWLSNSLRDPVILSQNIEQSQALPFEQNAEENIAVEEVISSDPAIERVAEISENELSQPIKKQPNKTNKPLAKNTRTAPTPKESTLTAAVADKEISETAILTPAQTIETPIIAPAEKLPTTESNEAIVLLEVESSEFEAEADVQSAPTPPAADIAYNTSADRVPPANARNHTAKRKQKKKVAKVNYYVGQIRNEDGQPMDAVKIEGFNTSFMTMSERNGEFVLAVDSPLTKITVSKDGFHTRKVDINQYADFLNISLVRKSTFPTDIADKKAALLEPKPAAGFMDFFKYLENNRIYPVGVKEKGIERDVEIHFYIDENGTPTNLKVVNPDLYGFDKEAIRLLENGPKWIPINSNARYYISFELE